MNPKRWIVKNIFPVMRECRYQVFEKPGYLKRVREKYHLENEKRTFYIIGTPNHCNLGDYAIGVAEKELLKSMFPNDNIVSVNMTEFGQDIAGIRELCKKEDIFILTGGGNLGNIYMDDENIRRRIITMFPEHEIYLFPQTMEFTNDEQGKTEQNLSKQVYSSHKHMHLSAREAVSRERMETLFEKEVFLLPDVVLTYPVKIQETIREGIYLCFRNDREKKVTQEEIEALRKELEEKYAEVNDFDTVNNSIIDPTLFGKAFKELLFQFKGAECIVTDRLHGMVLAAITETPCVVFSNNNHKVKGVYEWVKELPYIAFAEDTTEIAKQIRIVCEKKPEYDANRYKNEFIEFLADIPRN